MRILAVLVHGAATGQALAKPKVLLLVLVLGAVPDYMRHRHQTPLNSEVLGVLHRGAAITNSVAPQRCGML